MAAVMMLMISWEPLREDACSKNFFCFGINNSFEEHAKVSIADHEALLQLEFQFSQRIRKFQISCLAFSQTNLWC